MILSTCLFVEQKSTHFIFLRGNRLTDSKLIYAGETVAKPSYISSNGTLNLDGCDESSVVGSEILRQGKQGEQERGLQVQSFREGVYTAEFHYIFSRMTVLD